MSRTKWHHYKHSPVPQRTGPTIRSTGVKTPNRRKDCDEKKKKKKKIAFKVRCVPAYHTHTLTVYCQVERCAAGVTFHVGGRTGIRARLVSGNTAERQSADTDLHPGSLRDGAFLWESRLSVFTCVGVEVIEQGSKGWNVQGW